MRTAPDHPPWRPVNDPPIPIGDTSQPDLEIGDITNKEARAKAFAAQIYANYMENPEPPVSVPLQMGLATSPTHFYAAVTALPPHNSAAPTLI